MAARIPKEFSNFADEDSFLSTLVQEERGRDDEVESVGNESMRVNMNTNASDVVSLDDNISVSQIDPGNFSESDIDEDSGSNCCHSFTDVLGGFPESDIEEGEDEMSECLSDAGISFNSDLGSPMHSSCRSCRSYPVSEDRDEREESTPLPLYMAGPSQEPNTFQSLSHGRSVDYETNESDVSCQKGAGVKEDGNGGEFGSYPRRLRNSTRHRRKLSKAQTQPSTHYPKRNPRMAKKSEKSVKRTTALGGKRKALTVMRLLSDDLMPIPLRSLPSCGSGRDTSSPAPKSLSLSIPILDLCITEDEGYLGMAEETSEDSEKEKDENQLPMNLADL